VSEGQIIPHELALGYGITHQKPTNQEMANHPTPPIPHPQSMIHPTKPVQQEKKRKDYSGAPFLWLVRHIGWSTKMGRSKFVAKQK
jgi:hypothetical protein